MKEEDDIEMKEAADDKGRKEKEDDREVQKEEAMMEDITCLLEVLSLSLKRATNEDERLEADAEIEMLKNIRSQTKQR
jgi:hypothetical protein